MDSGHWASGIGSDICNRNSINVDIVKCCCKHGIGHIFISLNTGHHPIEQIYVLCISCDEEYSHFPSI